MCRSPIGRLRGASRYSVLHELIFFFEFDIVCLTLGVFVDIDGDLHLRNQVTVRKQRATKLSAANAQLWKTLTNARTHETELEAEDVETVEELVVLVDKDQVVQGQDEDTAVTATVFVTTKFINPPVEIGPITKQPSTVDQCTE